MTFLFRGCERGRFLSGANEDFGFARFFVGRTVVFGAPRGKECYERQKKLTKPEEWAALPARWALCEVVDLHDDSLEFEPIHRVVFGVDPQKLLADLLANIVLLFALIPDFRDAMPRIRWRQLRTILAYSFPLLVSGIAGVSNQFIDRQMIKYLLPSGISMDALGIYGAVSKLAVIIFLFTQMYRYAAEPYFLSGFKNDDFKRQNAEAQKYFIIVSIFMFLGITLFTNLFALMMGKDFREGVYMLPVILLANIFAGIWLNLSFWYKKTGETKYAIWITGTGLVFTLGLNLALTPVLGYFGAALARLGCETAMVAVSYYLNQKHYPVPYDLRRIGTYFLVGGAIYGASLLTSALPAALEYTLNLAMLAAFGFYAIRLEKIDMKGILHSIIKR